MAYTPMATQSGAISASVKVKTEEPDDFQSGLLGSTQISSVHSTVKDETDIGYTPVR